MAVKRYLYTSTILFILTFIAVCGTTSSAEAQKVHALLIILGNDRDIRESVNVNDSNMQTLLRLLSENCEVHMTVMRSVDETSGIVNEKTLANANVTAQSSPRQLGIIKVNQVTAWIRNLQPNSDDTVLIYYSGHGMINEDGIHILNFDPNVTNDFVTRDGLRDRLQQKPGRLKMLITDTCSNQGQRFNLIAKSYGRVVPRKRRYTEDLFLKHSGLLDITAASPGQYAWGNNQIGGYFTAALIENFTTSSDTNKDGFLSWGEVFFATRDETQKLFRETTFRSIDKQKMDNIGQKTQTPLKKDPLPVSLTQVEATLTITSTPSGAHVYINSTQVGKTPLENYKVEVGTSGEKQVKMRLELKGYRSMNLTIKGRHNKETGELTLKAGKTYTWQNVHLEKLRITQIDPSEKDNIDYSIKRIAQVFAGDTPLSSIGGIGNTFGVFLVLGIWWLLFGLFLWYFMEDSNFIKHFSIAPKIYPYIILFLCIASTLVYHFSFSPEIWVKFCVSYWLSILIGLISFFIVLLFSFSVSIAGGFSFFIGMVVFPTLFFLTLIIPDNIFLKFYEILVLLHIYQDVNPG